MYEVYEELIVLTMKECIQENIPSKKLPPVGDKPSCANNSVSVRENRKPIPRCWNCMDPQIYCLRKRPMI